MADLAEVLKAAIAEKFAPVVDFRAPYARVMLDASVAAQLSALEAAGYRVVPVEPTPEIMDTFFGMANGSRGILYEAEARENWKLILAAAPKVDSPAAEGGSRDG